jgi:hypothetical protein
MPIFTFLSHRRFRRWFVVSVVTGTVALAGVASVGVTPAAAGAEVSSPCVPHQLPGMPGSARGEVMTMNDGGLYVGGVRDASGTGHASWWTHAGPDVSTGWTVHVPDIPATEGEFLDVNESGLMSGVSYDTGRGFVYDSNSGAFTWLPDFASGSFSWARRINASGVVTGSAVDASGTSYAAIWRPPYATAHRVNAPGERQNITFPDGSHAKVGSETDGINDQGTVAGYTFLGGPVHDVAQWARSKQWRNAYAPLLQAFTKVASGSVTRMPAGYDQAIGFAINNSGLVVGASLRDANAWLLPAYWKGGTEHDMGAPDDAVFGYAYEVSQGGWAAGGIVLPDTARSFVWTGGGLLQLNKPLPGYDESWSHGVSDVLRQVAGSSTRADGTTVPTVWQCPAGFTTA